MIEALKILLLEDNEFDADIIYRIVKDEWPSHSWQHVSNSKEFTEALINFKPDVILSDNNLPDFSGAEALRIVKAKDAFLPFILVTGTVSEEFAIEMLKAGADDYILKDRLIRLPAAIQSVIRFLQSEKEKNEMFERLSASELKYRELVERVSDGFISANSDGEITYANATAESFFEFSPGDMVHRKLTEVLVVIDLPDLKDDLAHSFASGQPMAKDVCCHLRDKWLSVSCYISPTGGSIFLKDFSRQRDTEIKARNIELKYKTFVDRITDGFIVIDKFWNYVYINNRAAEIMRKSEIEVIGESIWAVFPDALDSVTHTAILHAMNEQCYVNAQDYYAPYNLWYEIHVYPSVEGVTVFLRDISIQKEQESKIRGMHQRMSTILNSLPAHIVMVDPEGIIIEVNDSWYQFAEEIGTEIQRVRPGNNLLHIINQFWPDAEEEKVRIEASVKATLSGNSDTFEYEFQIVAIQRWYRLITEKIKFDHTNGAVVMFMDITELKKLESERLSRDAEEQKKITTAVLEAQEKERDFIGSELHDNINQQQVGIQLALAGIRNKIQNDNGIVQFCLQNIRKVIVETRKLAHELVTPDFAQQSLKHQIENVLSEMLSAVGIRVVLRPENFKDKRLNSSQKIVLYRIVQEQCINIVKHAKATTVEVTLHIDEKHCRVTIADDGVGVDITRLSPGIGMRNIRARLTLVSGSLAIESVPGMGFTLIAIFPITSG